MMGPAFLDVRVGVPSRWPAIDEFRPALSDQAARPKTRWTKARWAGLSFPGTARTCSLASIVTASTPARVRRAVPKPWNRASAGSAA